MTVEETSTTARYQPEFTDGFALLVQAARWLLVAVLVANIAVGLLTRPHEDSLGQLRRDLSAGSVQSVTFASNSELPSSTLWLTELGSPGWDGSIVVWRTGAVSYRTAGLSTGGRFLATGADQPRVSVVRRQIETFARQREVTIHDRPRDALLRWPHLSTLVLLVLIVVMLRGGQPRLATRWATFWLLLTPLHIGMLRTLAQESPWSPATRALSEPLPHRSQPPDRRLTGGPALLVMLLTTVAVALVLAVLDRLRF